jgi:hypothetical protein
MRQDVETLASPAFEGRRGPGADKTAALIEARFRQLQLEPLFQGEYGQEVPQPVRGRNVGAVLRGSDPQLADEYVVLSAHYDHVGVRDGVLYPGADDNASGTAAVLEIARTLAGSPKRPRRTVVFLGFDLEEYGMLGSKYFAENPPFPLDRIRLFITSDMISRSLGGVAGSYVFVMGSEHAPGLRPWIERGARGLPLKVGLVGSDLLAVDRSDYGPFRARKVPYLFFSTGENPAYHTPEDRPETADYDKLAAVARLIQNVVVEAADGPESAPWVDPPDNPISEAATLDEVLRILLEHEKELGIKPFQKTLIEGQIKLLDGVQERGAITPLERQQMLRGAQFILYSIL